MAPNFMSFVEDIQILKEDFLSKLPDIPVGDQNFTEIFSDGSFDLLTGRGGGAIVILRGSEKIILSANYHIPKCFSSTHAEVIASFVVILAATKYRNINTLWTDSMATIDGIVRNPVGRAKVQEKFGFWLREIRKMKSNIQNIQIKYVKGHAIYNRK